MDSLILNLKDFTLGLPFLVKKFLSCNPSLYINYLMSKLFWNTLVRIFTSVFKSSDRSYILDYGAFKR